MTKPRQVLPGVSYLITRRCSERRFFLRPDPEVTQIFEYLLALLSKEHEIEVHAYVVMSNHYHLVVTDTQGRLPNFQRELNSLLARAINNFRGRTQAFWERKSYSAVALAEAEDMLSKMAYALANPVAGRLVNRARHWEGATSVGMEFGRPRTIERPRKFFGDKLPSTVELEITRPSCHEHMSEERLQQALNDRVAESENKSMAEFGKAMGMSRVMRQHWNSAPTTPESWGGMQPTVAARDKWVRMEMLQRSKEWLRQYKDALRQFVEGNRDVEFPPGTWWMCARLRCRRAST